MRGTSILAVLLCALGCGCGRGPAPAHSDRPVTELLSVRPLGVDLPFLAPYYFNPPPLGPDEARRQLDLASQRGITHARFFASQYWPSQMLDPATGWLTNPDAYFARFDQLFADAHSRGIRLIPSLLQNSYLFPDLMGEPRGMLFVPGSRSRQLAERYITEFVTRYRGNDTVLFWEIGNELNLGADLDSTCDASTPGGCDIAPLYGTPNFRSSADNYLSSSSLAGIKSAQEDLGQFTADLAQLIHSLDPTRSISSGDSVMRGSAYHLASRAAYPDWTGYGTLADSETQYAAMLAYLHPAPVDLVSMHPYPGVDLARFGDFDVAGSSFIAGTQSLARAMGKQLYVGEFGELNAGTFTCGSTVTDCGGDATRQATRRIIDTIVKNEVAYGDLWAYESSLDDECPLVPGCYDVVDSDPIVSYLSTRNLAYVTCTGRLDGASCPDGSCQGGVCMPSPFTPPLALPTTRKQWLFASASALGGWTTYTSCTSCQPGTFTFSSGWQPVAQATTYALPCSGDCAYPGLYVSSPEFAVTPGGALTLRFVGRSTVPDASVWVFVRDANNKDVAGFGAAPRQGTSMAVGGTTFVAPPTAAWAFVQIKVLEPNASVVLSSVSVSQQ